MKKLEELELQIKEIEKRLQTEKLYYTLDDVLKDMNGCIINFPHFRVDLDGQYTLAQLALLIRVLLSEYVSGDLKDTQ